MKKTTFFFITILIFISGILAQPGFKKDPIQVSFKQIETNSSELAIEIFVKMAQDVHIYTSEKQFFGIVETKSVKLGKMRLELPPPEMFQGEFDDEPAPVYGGEKKLLVFKTYQGHAGDTWEFEGYFSYQGCDLTACYPPKKARFSFTGKIPEKTETINTPVKPVEPTPVPTQTNDKPNMPITEDWQSIIQNFSITQAGGGYMNSSEFITFLRGKSENPFEDKSIWIILGLIILGGLALNLTPCVLPMIPINLAIIGAGAKAGSKMRGFMLGLVYGIGMALAYGSLGLIVILTGSQFGSINSSPWFNVGVAAIFVALALAMFDIIEIDFSRFSKSKIKEENKGKFFTAFFMGILAAVLAGACVAPVLISVLVYSHTLYLAGNKFALLLPFLLGIGMALPWPLAGASLSLMPKPGTWMQKVKYAFGIFIFLMAIYYGYLAYELWKNQEQPANQTTSAPTTDGLYFTHLELGLAESQKSGKPVFIDFWATWCKNCLTMDATTFKDAEVKKELEKFVMIKYQAENMDSPEHQKVILYFQQKLQWPTFGLPAYIILQPLKK